MTINVGLIITLRPAERAQQVRRWYETMVEFERQCDAFSDLTMAHPESPFVRAINAMAGAYTLAIDPGGTAEWFWLECDLGRAPKIAEVNGEERTIATVEDLIWLMGIEE